MKHNFSEIEHSLYIKWLLIAQWRLTVAGLAGFVGTGLFSTEHTELIAKDDWVYRNKKGDTIVFEKTGQQKSAIANHQNFIRYRVLYN